MHERACKMLKDLHSVYQISKKNILQRRLLLIFNFLDKELNDSFLSVCHLASLFGHWQTEFPIAILLYGKKCFVF